MNKQLDVSIMMRRVYERGLTTLSGGNLSMRVGDDIWITPSGIDKGNLDSPDTVCIKGDGTITGKHRPSSEYPFHQAIYSAREDVRVILHAHSPALVAYCIAHKIPDTRIIKEAYALCGEIGYADYVMPGSPQLGEKLASVFSRGYNVVQMENHGVVVVASTIEEAYERLVSASHIAEITLHATALGDVITLKNLQEEKWFAPQYSTEDTDSLAQQLEMTLSRGIDNRLFPGRTARVIARRENGDILVRGFDKYPQIKIEKPYLIEAQPPYLMAFAVTHTALDTRTIPEAYTSLHHVPLVEDNSTAIESALTQHEAIIVKNSRIIVKGKTLLQAYDGLEVLEYTARSIIEATRIGGVVPMSKQAIQDLDETYHQYYKGLSG